MGVSMLSWLKKLQSGRRVADAASTGGEATSHDSSCTTAILGAGVMQRCAADVREASCCAHTQIPPTATWAAAAPTTLPDPLPFLLGNNYQFVRLINRCGQGAVVQATHLATGDPVAIKLLLRHAGLDVNSVTSSLVNHAALSAHPHIVGFREAFLTPYHLAVAMELADGGDLAEHLSLHVLRTGEGLSEPAARCIFQQLASALEWIHRSGVAVGDVKCDNVLLAGRGRAVRVADFGWSCANAVGGRCGGRLCGTPEYIAPEILLRTPGTDARAADCWAAGATLWALLGGGFPFLSPAEESLDRAARMAVMAPRILRGDPRQLPCRVTPALANLLGRMLDVNPATRITAAEVAVHPWAVKDLPPALARLNDRLAAEAGGCGGRSGGTIGGSAATCGQRHRQTGLPAGSCCDGGGGAAFAPGWAVRQSPQELAALVQQAAAAAVADPFPPDVVSLLGSLYDDGGFGCQQRLPKRPQQRPQQCCGAGAQAACC